MKHLKKFNTDNLFKFFKKTDTYKPPVVVKIISDNHILYVPRDKYNCPYKRIEYLENPNNDAVINTYDLPVTITAEQLTNASYIEYTTECIIPNDVEGGAEGKSGVFFFIGLSNYHFYSGLGRNYKTSNTVNDGERHIIKLTKENGYANLYLDNIVIDSYECTGFNMDLDNFGLFFCHNYNGHLRKQKKYYAKLQINNNVIFEMIPVRIGDIGYMWDAVTKELYGSGNKDHKFILGPDI